MGLLVVYFVTAVCPAPCVHEFVVFEFVHVAQTNIVLIVSFPKILYFKKKTYIFYMNYKSSMLFLS